MKSFLLICVLLPYILFGQTRNHKKQKEIQLNQIEQTAIALKTQDFNLQSTFLASGAEAWDSVFNYIGAQLKDAGLEPKIPNDFVETTIVKHEKQIDSATFLKVNGHTLSLSNDYFPFPFSAIKAVSGMPSIALREKNLPWFIDIKDLAETKSFADSGIYKTIMAEAQRASLKGATALFVYYTDSQYQVKYDSENFLQESPIPVVYLNHECMKIYFPDPSDLSDIELNVVVKNKYYYRKRLLGLINNESKKTAIIRAPLFVNTNSLGVSFSEAAMAIEIAKATKNAQLRNYNYLYLFEEFDNSKTWLDSSSTQFDYGLQLQNLKLTAFNNLVVKYDSGNAIGNSYFSKLTSDDLGLIIDSSNTKVGEARDFLLCTFSVTEDSSTIIDFNKVAITFRHIMGLIKYADSLLASANEKIDTTTILQNNKVTQQVIVSNVLAVDSNKIAEKAYVEKTNVDVKPNMIPGKTTVSFGVIADLKYVGEGLRIKGLTPKKTGEKIGLQSMDVLMQLGDYKISNFNSYLQALSHFNPGDNTILYIKRNNEDKEFAVVF